MKKIVIFLIIIGLILSFLFVKSSLTTYDVTDEAIINASPDVVFKALQDEFAGKTSWWMPHLSSKPRDEHSYGKIGSLIDVTVHGKRPIKFTSKTAEVKKNEMMRGFYVEGAFRGENLWKLESVNGKTKLSMRWRVKASGLLLKILAPFFPIEKNHSEVMKAGFENLNTFLDK